MKIILSLIVIATAMISSSAFSQTVITEGLNEEELLPFCTNNTIWQHMNIKPEECLSAAKSCSDKVSRMKLDINKATEQLYICVFDVLKIDFSQ